MTRTRQRIGFAGRGAAWLLAAATAWGAEQELNITHRAVMGQTPPIPIVLRGFTGEVATVLAFDLTVVGFKVTNGGADWLVSGSNAGQVKGALRDEVSGRDLFAKTYKGGSLRQQAHALADDIVRAVLRLPGIARTRIAFKRIQGGSSEIYVSDYDGYHATAVTADHSVVAAPCWAPGRNLLFYTSYLKGNPDILSHQLGTGKRRFVARYTGSNMSPAVSPDGRRVAMILTKSGSPDLYVADLDGQNLRRLTRTRVDEASPCWSPDGRTLCFSTRLNGRRTLATIPASGGALKRLRASGVVNPSEPDWSPDGRWIAFTAQMGSFQICVVPAAGGTATVLAPGEDPVWSPNSRTLIYVRRDRRGNRTLSLLDALTKQRKDVRTGLGSCSQPTWAR